MIKDIVARSVELELATAARHVDLNQAATHVAIAANVGARVEAWLAEEPGADPEPADYLHDIFGVLEEIRDILRRGEDASHE